MHLGERCKKWRKTHGYTQEQIADICHCSASLVSLFESGKRKAPSVMRGFISLGCPIKTREVIDFLEGKQ